MKIQIQKFFVSGFALLILCFAFALKPTGLFFTDGSTDNVDVGSPVEFDNMSTGTIMAWIKPQVLSGSQAIVAKRASASQQIAFIESGSSGDFRFLMERATTQLNVTSSTTPLTTGNWHFVACTWDAAGVNADQKLFHGTLTASVTEVATYSAQTVGSGAQGDDSAASMGLGNMAGGFSTFAFAGDIAVVAIWNVALNEGQIKAQQYWPHKTANNIGLWWLGFNGVGTQADWSGNGNNGTVTGATQSDNVPIW